MTIPILHFGHRGANLTQIFCSLVAARRGRGGAKETVRCRKKEHQARVYTRPDILIGGNCSTPDPSDWNEAANGGSRAGKATMTFLFAFYAKRTTQWFAREYLSHHSDGPNREHVTEWGSHISFTEGHRAPIINSSTINVCCFLFPCPSFVSSAIVNPICSR